MVSNPFFTLEDLSVSVRGRNGQRTILKDVSLSVAPGKVVAIVGPSGGGKSTLLKSVLGLTRFASGTISYEGAGVLRPLDEVHRRLRASAEAVLQNPVSALNPYTTLRTAIEEPLRARGIAKRERQSLAVTVATRMGLTAETLDRRPHMVSFGQAQRACIARAIAPRPRLLVLDEPISALDALVAAEVAALLADVISETHPTVLFVSHDMRLVRRLATRVVVVEAGRVVEDKSARVLLTAPQSDAACALVACDNNRRAALSAAGTTKTQEAIA